MKISQKEFYESMNSFSGSLQPEMRPTSVLLVTAALPLFAEAIVSPAIADPLIWWELYDTWRIGSVLSCASSSFFMFPRRMEKSMLLVMEVSEYPRTRTIDSPDFLITREARSVTWYRTVQLKCLMQDRSLALNWSWATFTSPNIWQNRFWRAASSQTSLIWTDQKDEKLHYLIALQVFECIVGILALQDHES